MKFANSFTFICVLLFIATVFIGSSSSMKDSWDVYLFYTGELKGELEPCGCSGIKSGGMLYRSSWIDFIRAKSDDRFYFIDGGFSLLSSDRQVEIKSVVFRKILESLDYDLQFIERGEKVKKVKKNPLLLSNENNYQVKTFQSNKGKDVNILFYAIQDKFNKNDLDNIYKKILPDVLFIMAKNINYEFIHKYPCFQIILGLDLQEPVTPNYLKTGALLIGSGDKGRYGGIIKISFDGENIKYKNKNIPFRKIPYPINSKVNALIDNYKKQVKEEDLLYKIIKQSSPIGYIGSEMCIDCHKEEYEKWSQKAHAKAFDTLVQENYHYDPECVGCHVVGFKYEEGFRILDESEHLIHVGCETCHGPGARHYITENKDYGKTEGEKTCLECHHKDRSPNFKYETYLEQIKHWKD